MNAVSVIAHFAFGKDCRDGQTVKTRIITDELCRVFGDSRVRKIDTHGGVKNLLRAPWQVVSAMRSADNVIIMPAHNGLRVYAPLLAAAAWFFPKKRLHYVVIGGWLAEFLRKRPLLRSSLRRFSGIYVETRSMKQALENMGFDNAELLPNCKNLPILKPEDLPEHKKPYQFCTFSRVMREKGIEDAVEAVREINEAAGETVCTLDIYGHVDPGQTEWFAALEQRFPAYVRYCGVVAFDKSVDVLKNYYALLFPTFYDGEGFAGTLLDAMASGVPVIASDWKYNPELVKEGHTGVLYRTGDRTELRNRMYSAMWDADRWNAQRTKCLCEAQTYLPEIVIRKLADNLKA